MRWRPAVALTAAACLGAFLWFRPPPPRIAPGDQPARFVGSYAWERDDPWFGGFSGLEVSADGASFTAITDRSHIAQGTFERTGDRISGVVVTDERQLADVAGKIMKDNWVDAEGLALRPDGGFYVSFEHHHRVYVYAGIDSDPFWARYHPDFSTMRKNGSFEALAIDDRGRVYTMPERVDGGVTETPVYRLDDPVWSQPFSIPRSDGFLPVGADFGPDGLLYLLERDVYPFGFRSRVRALEIGEDGVTGDRTVLETAHGQFGNLEGLAVWRDAAGHIRLTMLADDNFLPVQRTEWVEYVLRE